VGPFPLETYEHARTWATRIASATRAGKMPPWPAEERADCPPQVGSRRLSQAEIATLETWAAAKAPEGGAIEAPAPLPPAWGVLDHVDAVVRSTEPYLPIRAFDDYRCFLMDPGITADAFITAFAVREDVPGIIHHVHLNSVDTEEDAAKLRALDEAEPGAGFPCNKNPILTRYLTTWAPSDPIRRHPPGTGLKALGGRQMMVEIHYHDEGVGVPDATAVELELESQVEREAVIWALSPPEFALPPRMQETRVTQLGWAMEKNFRVWGARAHMHSLGRSEQLTIEGPEGGSRCVLSVPRWDSAWQYMYFFPEPIDLPAGSQLAVSCTYDTTSRSDVTVYGIKSTDEMCFSYFYVTSD
jgi:hypothetical protein